MRAPCHGLDGGGGLAGFGEKGNAKKGQIVQQELVVTATNHGISTGATTTSTKTTTTTGLMASSSPCLSQRSEVAAASPSRQKQQQESQPQQVPARDCVALESIFCQLIREKTCMCQIFHCPRTVRFFKRTDILY